MRDWTRSGSLLLGLLLLATACGEPPSSQGSPQAPPLDGPAPEVFVGEQPTDAISDEFGPRVIFLGDSISAGLHLPMAQAFPNVLQRRFAERGVPFRLVNAGVSGDTTSTGRSRLPWLLAQKPHVLVVQLGANDGLRGIPLAAIESNLRAIVTDAAAAGVRVLLLGMRLPPSLGQEYVDGFDGIYDRIAADTGVAYVPFFMNGVAGDPDLNLPDGIHPIARGHEHLATNVEDELEGLVRALSRR